MPTAEELSRILLWVFTGLLGGFGFATPEAILDLLQPEILAAIMAVVAATWRALRPPVVEQ
jgi:hypothetical protein